MGVEEEEDALPATQTVRKISEDELRRVAHQTSCFVNTLLMLRFLRRRQDIRALIEAHCVE